MVRFRTRRRCAVRPLGPSRAPAGRAPTRGRTPDAVRDADRRAADRAHRPRARRGPGHDRLAPRARGPAGPVDLDHPAHPPRGRASSCPSRASARAARGSGSRPRRPTSCGSPTSPTGAWPTGARSRSLDWLDDHSRYLLGCTAFRRVAGDDVVATFTAAGEEHGWPAATLTDNGAVYTSRFTGGRNGFEYLLAYLGIRQKNGAPGPSPDPGQDRALPPDPEALARAASRRRGPSPSCRPSSTPSASPTTSSGRTGRSAGSRPARRTGRRPGRSPPGPAPRATSASATTSPTARAPSPCAGPAACTTSRSARPMPAGGSSPSSTSRRSRSSPSTPARSSRPT